MAEPAPEQTAPWRAVLDDDGYTTLALLNLLEECDADRELVHPCVEPILHAAVRPILEALKQRRCELRQSIADGLVEDKDLADARSLIAQIDEVADGGQDGIGAARRIAAASDAAKLADLDRRVSLLEEHRGGHGESPEGADRFKSAKALRLVEDGPGRR